MSWGLSPVSWGVSSLPSTWCHLPFSWCPCSRFLAVPMALQQLLYPTHTHRFKFVILFKENLNFSEEGIKLFCYYLPTLSLHFIFCFVSDSSHTMLQRLLKSFTQSKCQLFKCDKTFCLGKTASDISSAKNLEKLLSHRPLGIFQNTRMEIIWIFIFVWAFRYSSGC